MGRRMDAVTRILGLVEPGRLIDLATGHGLYATLAADLGWKVTAVDARTERWPDDPRVEWIQADVREVDLEPYDVILCLGIFYHLTDGDQLALLARADRPMLIDTHLDHGTHEHSLSERVTTPDGYEGRWYAERSGPKASWGNDASFWPTLDSFHRMCETSGFATVLTLEPWYMGDRTLFLALP